MALEVGKAIVFRRACKRNLVIHIHFRLREYLILVHSDLECLAFGALEVLEELFGPLTLHRLQDFISPFRVH